MKHITSALSITAAALLVAGIAIPAKATELSQAVIRTIYSEEATPAIAQSIGILKNTPKGDRFAVIQFTGGAWALALVPNAVHVSKQDVIELPIHETELPNTSRIALVKMLGTVSASNLSTSRVAIN
jgi:hypothetical protein